jgi:hypothetical protein
MLGMTHNDGHRQELPLFEGLETEGTYVTHPCTSRESLPVGSSPKMERGYIAIIGRPYARTLAILRIGSGLRRKDITLVTCIPMAKWFSGVGARNTFG